VIRRGAGVRTSRLYGPVMLPAASISMKTPFTFDPDVAEMIAKRNPFCRSFSAFVHVLLHRPCLLPYPDIKTTASAARLSFTSHPRACAAAIIGCNFMNRAFVTIRGKGHMSHIANAILKVSEAARR
jgi:hypothetical protein